MNEARYIFIEESTDKTFDQLYIEFRVDVDSGITYGALDTLSSILLKFNKQIEEIKQCLNDKQDKFKIEKNVDPFSGLTQHSILIEGEKKDE